MTTTTIALTRLVQSKANVRRTGQTTGLEALMASIAAHGLRQNLNVRPTTGGRFEVIAGGRRLIALKKLARAGTIPADMPVPCLVLGADDNATEISLAENQLREAMHPDDQCAAFQSLTETGMPVEDVAARFGVTPAVVRQRLKLAAVSPKLRALYRAGETTLAHMMALTLSDDHAAQERALAEGGSPSGIRHALTRASVRADSRVVRFVGLDAYREAGGGVLDDLFNPADSYLTDPDLLNRLAEAKLAEAAEAVAAEGGEPSARPDYPAALVTELTGHRTAALRLGLARSPEVALTAVVHALVLACRNSYTAGSALQLTVKCRDLAGVITDTGECVAHAVLAAEVDRWTPLLPAEPAALWDWLTAQETDTLLEVLACFAALTLDAVIGKVGSGSLRHADQLANALDLDMATCWQPTPRMLERVGKRVMAEALTETGHAGLAADIMLMKKPVAVVRAAAALAGAGWLPPVLRHPAGSAANDNGPMVAEVHTDAEPHGQAA